MSVRAEKVSDCVDAVFVLSVASFTQRIGHIKRHFQEHNVDFDFIFDFDPDKINPQLLEDRFEESEMRLPHKSLVLKHIKAWQIARERSLKRILVFEDDAFLCHDFTRKLCAGVPSMDKLDEGYLVYLGGSDTKVSDSFFLCNELLVPQPIATTEGYITDLDAVNRRLDWIEKNKINLPADHLVRSIDSLIGVRQYWFREPLVEQGSVFGVFDTELDSSRSKHGRFYNVLRYKWNKFQRRKLRRWLVRMKAMFGIKVS
ncbi:MAG: glycosyltransferase family 25 protein [Candidatus Thiodiazotropha sp. (ex Monitilora ramsayi)]|nr:glycosyltransferase family 25 protein [Candidatus Thiodiazotropha sp. (ex Monitilora ramsayi)]